MIKAGEFLVADLVLRLPLTPPPGVQQPRAWKGWSVTLLRRSDISLEGAGETLEYAIRLVRIRPAGKRTYRLTCSTIPWVPDGLYDLRIEGPGFSALERSSVRVGVDGERDEGPEMVKRGDGVLVLTNRSSRGWRGMIDVVIPADGPGMVASVDGVELPLRFAAWSRVPGTGPAPDRILGFEVSVPPADGINPGSTLVELSKRAPLKGVFKVNWNGSDRGPRPVDWRELTVDSSFEPTGIIWEFGDGEWGFGSRVSHRWLFSDEAVAQVTLFDRLGGVHTVRSTRPVRTPMTRDGCGCAQVAAKPGLAFWEIFWQIVGIRVQPRRVGVTDRPGFFER